MTPKALATLDGNLKKIRDACATTREQLPADDPDSRAVHGRLGTVVRELVNCIAHTTLALRRAAEEAAPTAEAKDEPALP